MENNQADPSPQPTPPPPSAPPHSSSQVVWPPHTQSYEINDATSSNQYNDEVQSEVDYSADSSAGVQDFSSGTYPDRFQSVASASSGQMIRTMGYDQGTDQGSPFSPQPSTSGSFQVPLQGYDRISPVDDYQNSPAPSSDDHLQQYDPLPSLADQSDQVSSAAMPSQSHMSITIANARVDSPSTVDRDPSPLAIDCSSVALQSQRIPSPLTTMAGQRMSNNLATRYLTSDIVESTISAHGISLPQHQKELLVEAVTRNMVANQLQNANMLLQSQSQRIPSPINMVVSQSQRIPSPNGMEYGNLHTNTLTLNRNINSMQNMGVNQRAMSPVGSVVQNSHRYSPVQLRAMSTSPILSSSQLAMQNYVSSSTGPMERAASANIISSGAVIDSTVDSTVETADSHLGTADEVVGSSGAAYMADLDSADGTLDTTQGVSTTADEMSVDSGTPNSIVSSQANHLSMSATIDTTVDGIDTTVNTTSLDASAASGNWLHQDGLNPVVSLPNSVSSAMISQHMRLMDQMESVANSRPRRQLHKQRLLAEQDVQRNGDNRIPYSGREFWCEECNMSYDSECTRHRIQTIFDKPVLSRAWASLPGAYLAINKVALTDAGDAVYGVFSKKSIPKRTKFGPVEGVITKLDEVISDDLVLQIEAESGELMHLDTSDESLSNWMRFVRPADNYCEQNLVVIQSEQSLYFLSTKQINPRTELKVGYAQQYAERRNLKMLEPDREEMKAVEDQENAWPCFECNKQFSNSEDLQKHLNEHETGEAIPDNDVSVNPARKKGRSRGRPPKKPKPRASKKCKVHEDLQVALDTLDEATVEALARRPHGRPHKKFRLGSDKSDEFKCHFCPKTFPRNYSLQRHLSMHSGDKKFDCPICGRTFSHVYNRNRHVRRHKTQDGNEPYTRPVKSLFRKKQAEGNEWLCTHCDLTFDNSSLLNLHTLTHAAEDIGLEEVARFAVEPDFTLKNGISENYKNELEAHLENGALKCPQCTQEFGSKKELIEHASAHGKVVIRRSFRGMVNPAKPFKCELCYKSFASEERLLRHNLVHGSEDTKPLQCDICFKRFLNNSALACHIKVHSDEKKYYECPICKEGFDQIILLKDHVHIHCINGSYTCPNCRKGFEEYNQIRKHIRAFHSEKRYPCDQCDKIFPRPDKLKLHMLRHSDHREFLCANCGKQFKRKDKLKEHMKRMHSAEREARLAMKPTKPTSSKKFIPKVSPTDYHRFIYKCHSCLLGFKRRGMLVNHLAKRHPDIRPESVPELNLPILKTTRDYYCQYCEKVYKSSSKRKAHILKNHPGAELPMSNRRKGGIPEIPGLPNPTFSQTVGSITTHPHNCDWCHKQYASKAKLLQHQRKKHLELLPQVESGCYSPRQTQQIPRTHHRDFNTSYPVTISAENQTTEEEYADSVVIDASSKRKDLTPAPRPPSVYVERDTNTPAMPPQTTVESLQAADLLTQAMSELTQTLSEYRPSNAEFHLSRMSQSGPPTMVQPSPATTPIPQSTTPIPTATTLEQNQLGQILAQYQSQQAARASLSPGPQVSPSESPSPNSFVPRTWATTFATYPAR